MQPGSMFICNCNIALHVSDAFCLHPMEHLETVVAASGEWLLLQFLIAPEDGRKKRPKHVEQYCSYK